MAIQNDIESIQDKLRRGLISTDEANVLLVQVQGVRLIVNKIPRSVRRALTVAVKDGRLGHLKKEPHKPEAFFHKNALHDAKEKRNSYAHNICSALNRTCA